MYSQRTCEKMPLKIWDKRERGRIQGLPNFLSTPYYLASLSGLSTIMDNIAKRRRALLGHIVRLSEAVSANQALHCHIDASLDWPPQST